MKIAVDVLLEKNDDELRHDLITALHRIDSLVNELYQINNKVHDSIKYQEELSNELLNKYKNQIKQ